MPRKSKDHNEIMKYINQVRDDLRSEIDEIRTRIMRVEALFADSTSLSLTDGQRLKTIRKLLKLNVSQFASHVGYSAAAISYMERGLRSSTRLLQELKKSKNIPVASALDGQRVV